MKISVCLDHPLRPVQPGIIGINTNFLTDHAVARQAGLGFETALRQMGVRSLRYPGGEKSDEFFWSTPPWDAPRPTLALTGPGGRLSPMNDYVENYSNFRYPPLDFDQFIDLCRSINAEPIVCVNFDSMYLPPISEKGTAPSKAQLLEHAVEWVRYANRVQGYGVRYWELGNESYLLGHNGAAKAADYARDFVEFSRAMKAVDPTILLGANGHTHKNSRGKADGEDGPIWWQTVLETAAADIDYLAVHPYPCWMWGSYEHYIHHTPDFAESASEAQAALEEWAPEHAERIRVLVTETNAADWAGSEHFPGLKGWPMDNDLGHALVLFEILGHLLLHPKVDLAQVWNTRWVHPTHKTLWNTLDENNQLNATGQAIALWGQHLQKVMVETTSTDLVRSFASQDPEHGQLSLFLINKDRQPQRVQVEIHGAQAGWQGSGWALHGSGPQDCAPQYTPLELAAARHHDLQVELPAVSITVLRLEPEVPQSNPTLSMNKDEE